MSKQYSVQQVNYQNSMNADDYDENVKLAAMVDQGYVIHTADVSSWPYITILWERDAPEPDPEPEPAPVPEVAPEPVAAAVPEPVATEPVPEPVQPDAPAEG